MSGDASIEGWGLIYREGWDGCIREQDFGYSPKNDG